ncbi:glycosyltransferase family 4 protein [Cerasicoccus fimbriatus]|uniref:glycosyltransferase family 4 protein n=1 Tax=Cerasicoccus fimbriatus TaxID=3014554 RepID=UPI0022B41B3B|nr:glycosyltransferase family 4 protein [Cerasicoccus sp. TK19100]
MAKRLLLISQVYVPDPAAVGQYMADAAEEMAARGWEVTVLTADRGYDNPEEQFPRQEVLNGVRIRRLPFSSLGKGSIKQRLAGQLLFCLQAFLHGLFMRKPDAVLVTTSPPMGSGVAVALRWLRRVKVKFWVMDINPDQVVVQKILPESHPMVKAFEWLNRRALAASADVISLDRFMLATMKRKLPTAPCQHHEIPPWPMENHLERIEHAQNSFRTKHGLDDKLVVMYSGNHSVVHPLGTVIQAALQMQDCDKVMFVFIGGGLGKEDVDAAIEQHQPKNMLSLPYQPLDQIRYSLSAADVHLVSMGEKMVGVVHPCKFYNALSLAKPILLLGPSECHVGDVLREHDCGWRVNHGDVDAAETLFRTLVKMDSSAIELKGRNGRELVESHLGKSVLINQFAEVLDS